MELPQLGKHCTLSSCQSLDFLPVACPFCREVYCGDHRLPATHGCIQWNNYDKKVTTCPECQQLVFNEHQSQDETLKAHQASQCRLHLYPSSASSKTKPCSCQVQGCHDLDPHIGPAHCNGCGRDYCLRHRYPAVHDCASLKVDVKDQRRAQAQEKLAKTFTPTFTASSPPIKMTKKTSVTNPKIELMKIKAKAKGLGSVPMASRLYVHVQFPNESRQSTQPMYLDKYNRAGKTLDLLTDYAHIKNNNHTLPPDHPERLVLNYQHQDQAPVCLDLSKTLEEQVENVSTIILTHQGLSSS
ncbi:hypothetical protein DM01DRAFT_1337001 [Hesseltinella vesiculosa]|uniref:AN1-type domain-containing protein n=1 Tax=Hesseltinella vesiculosa TaxID=101127 RepID=A0A1X2GEM9_9FUNG|nr:hypothetical protein DM01DRAFT_1337001 [Hesseltinella vesiculosa]